MKNMQRFCVHLCTLLFLAFPVFALAQDLTPEEYWKQIQEIGKKAYSGMDISLALNTGYNFGGDNKGAAVGVSVPLYSKKDKMKRREDVVQFLKTGAELIQKLETSQSTAQIYKEASKFLYAKFNEEGIDAVTAYYEHLAKIAEQEAKIRQYHREIQSLISPFAGSSSIIPVKLEE